jgi:S-formylglutathione hydrolase FrmB
VLVVMPDGGKRFYSGWLAGRTETFHLVELRRILRRDYRASPVMAVVSASMGGLGALAAPPAIPACSAPPRRGGIADTRLSAQSMRYVDLVRSGRRPH